jgi:hypothetical protein
MSTATVLSSLDRTLERTAQLSQYLRAEVLNERFLCRSYDVCRASCSDRVFYEGQLPHVGQHYDLQVDGKPTRIVIVGQEYGHGPALVRLEGRAAMIRDAAAKLFRGRNPHMKGTTTILRLLLRRNPGDDALNEQLFPNSAVHIFEGFALVNYLLCSAIESSRDLSTGGGAKGLSSSKMRQNCASHFRQTIETLDPTIIIAQGIGVGKWIKKAYKLADRGPIDIIEIGNAKLPTLVHPSARSHKCWGNSLRSEYLWNIVVPAIARLLVDSGVAIKVPV